MSTKIAKSTIESAPTEDLAVSDVYSAKSSEPVNVNKPNAVVQAVQDVGKSLQQNIKIVDLVKATEVQDGKASVSKESALSLLKSATGGSNSPLASLQGAIQDELLKAIGFKDDKEVTPTGSGCDNKNPDIQRQKDIAALEKAIATSKPEDNPCKTKTKKGLFTLTGIKTVYATIQSVKHADLHSAQGVAAMLNSISGNSKLAEVLDMESKFAVLGKIMAKASALGIPEAIDMILDKVADDKERKRLLIDNLKNFVYQSDLIAINKVIDYVGPHGALERVPDFVNLLMTFYHYPAGSYQPTVALRDQLANTLARVDPNWYRYNRRRVNDPNWFLENRNCDSPGALVDNWINNLEPFTYASNDAIALFLLPAPAEAPFTVVTNTWYESAVIAQTHLSRGLLELAKEDFPYAVLEAPKLYA